MVSITYESVLFIRSSIGFSTGAYNFIVLNPIFFRGNSGLSEEDYVALTLPGTWFSDGQEKTFGHLDVYGSGIGSNASLDRVGAVRHGLSNTLIKPVHVTMSHPEQEIVFTIPPGVDGDNPIPTENRYSVRDWIDSLAQTTNRATAYEFNITFAQDNVRLYAGTQTVTKAYMGDTALSRIKMGNTRIF